MLSLRERADLYGKAFPKYPPMVATDKWLLGLWYCTRPMRQKQDYYGKYPATYLKRVRALFPDCKNILHLFSGRVDKELWEITFDSNPDLLPDVTGDVLKIRSYFGSDQFDLIIADPPYTETDFKKYNTKPFDRAKVIKEVWHVCSKYLVWLDLVIPRYRKDMWTLIGTIAVIPGTNCKVRVASIFEKVDSKVN